MTDAMPARDAKHTVAEVLEGIPEDQLMAEFKFLSISTENPLRQDVGTQQRNHDKNRWKGFYAYDHSRVVLSPSEEEGDYINANHIPNCFGNNGAFIATQGPLKHTVNDFWRMIWQQKANRIIMVTNLNGPDPQHNLCAKYWPEIEHEMTCGKIRVLCSQVEQSPQITTRFFTLSLGSESRQVIQFHFLGWPDRGVPSHTGSLLRFWQTVEKYADSAMSPVVTHCSAGVGRTGTFLAMWQAIKEAVATGKVSICDYVIKMRQSRYLMVQNYDQYRFIYAALQHALKTGILELADVQVADFEPNSSKDDILTKKDSEHADGAIEDQEASR